jgi:hypothetical protein
LLIRVLQAKGDAELKFLPKIRIGNHANPNHGADVTQVRVIAKDTVAPDYKILLYPHMDGDPLPDTKMKGPSAGSGQALTVSWDGGSEQVRFNKTDGRTNIELRK